ncbi:MAG: hypothetical protein ACHQHM_05555 [Thermoanaerobaculales bacterium]
MTTMVRTQALMAGAACLAGALAVASPSRELTHRVWLLGGVPDEATVTALASAGVAGVVLPVGRVEVAPQGSRFTLSPLPNLSPIGRFPVTALVWVEGEGKASGDAAMFGAQFAPVARSLGTNGGLILAARRYFPGLPFFAAGVARKLQAPVELALSAGDLSEHLPNGGWPGVRLLAFALGNPTALSFAASTLQDDLVALARVDTAGARFRVGIIVAPGANPAPGPGGASLAVLANSEVASYRPGEDGDVFILRRAVDWGGVALEADQRVSVSVVDTARYNRDVGLILRPVRGSLEGWDTVGLPAPEPTLGMSREAFLDYLNGGLPYPSPRTEVEWPSPTTLKVSVSNPTAHGSAIATVGNWIELRFSGTVVRDLRLGEFGGVEYGRWDGETWRRTVVRDANTVRLYLTYVPPRARLGGVVVTFLTRPREVAARWGLRLGDGSDLVGPLRPVPLPGK